MERGDLDKGKINSPVGPVVLEVRQSPAQNAKTSNEISSAECHSTLCVFVVKKINKICFMFASLPVENHDQVLRIDQKETKADKDKGINTQAERADKRTCSLDSKRVGGRVVNVLLGCVNRSLG